MFNWSGLRSAIWMALACLALSIAAPAVPPAAAQQGENATTTATNEVRENPPAPPVADTTKNGGNVARPPDTVSDDVYSEMFKILFATLVLAVVIESALALIFNWRPFLLKFDGRGVRSLVAFAVSWMVARSLGLDIIERLSEATNARSDAPTSELGFALTGLVLAGGSAGVNNILRSFGFRQVYRAEEIRPTPPKNEAWAAVRLVRANAVGPVVVQLKRPLQDPRLIGTITGHRRPFRLIAWALTDEMRFPPVAGFRVNGGEEISVILVGKDKDGQPVSATWGPYTIEAGAIIDFEVKL